MRRIISEFNLEKSVTTLFESSHGTIVPTHKIWATQPFLDLSLPSSQIVHYSKQELSNLVTHCNYFAS